MLCRQKALASASASASTPPLHSTPIPIPIPNPIPFVSASLLHRSGSAGLNSGVTPPATRLVKVRNRKSKVKCRTLAQTNRLTDIIPSQIFNVQRSIFGLEPFGQFLSRMQLELRASPRPESQFFSAFFAASLEVWVTILWFLRVLMRCWVHWGENNLV